MRKLIVARLPGRENLPCVVVLFGSNPRLFPVQTGVGPGQRGLTGSYVQVNTALVPDKQATYPWPPFSAEPLARPARSIG